MSSACVASIAASWPAGRHRDRLPRFPLPKPLHLVCDLGLLWPDEPHLQIAPAGRCGQMPRLGVARSRQSALVDEIHPAEIPDAIVNDQ